MYDADVFDFLAKLEDESVDLAIVDPPYNLGIAEWDRFPSAEAYFAFTDKWIDALLPVLRKDSSLYVFNTAANAARIMIMLEQKGLFFRNWITWYKKDGFSNTRRKYTNAQETILFFTRTNDYVFNYDEVRQPYESVERIAHAAKKGILKNGKRWFPNEKGKLCNDVWEFTSQRHKEKVGGKVIKPLHPTKKPFEMIERMIKASSEADDLVLDLFSGSGTTSAAAEKLGRQFIGCENNAAYISELRAKGVPIGGL